MGSIILFDRNSQVDRVDSLRRAENGDFQKKEEEKNNSHPFQASAEFRLSTMQLGRKIYIF